MPTTSSVEETEDTGTGQSAADRYVEEQGKLRVPYIRVTPSSLYSIANSPTPSVYPPAAKDTRHAKKRQIVHDNEVNPKKARAQVEQETRAFDIGEKELLLKPVAVDTRAGGRSETLGEDAVSVPTEDSKASTSADEDERQDDRLTFPERLMHLLQHGIEPNALWWQKDGASFGFEPKVFTDNVLNRLFPTKIKFESFIRKLNRWYVRNIW
jgi:HSF-type DNA-binding